MHSKTDTKKSSPFFPIIEILLSGHLIFGIGRFLYFQQGMTKYQQMTPTASDFLQMETTIAGKEKEIEDHTNACASERNTAISRFEAAKEEYAAALNEKETVTEQLRSAEEALDLAENAQDRAYEMRRSYAKAIRELEDLILADKSPYRICYLTFDDGPSYYTGKFLDKLDELGIPATFFTIGVEMSSLDYDLRDAYLRREAASGHTVANHTYSHAYNGEVYRSVQSFMDAVSKQDELVYSTTGLHTEIVRFPAGSYYCPQRTSTIEALHESGYAYIDWTANAFDAGYNNYTPEYTASSVILQVKKQKISVVLMHDWIMNTLKSLDGIVPPLQEEGYIFLPLFPESTTMQS